MKIMHQRFGLAKTGRSAKRAKTKSRTLCVAAGEHAGPFFPRAAHRYGRALYGLVQLRETAQEPWRPVARDGGWHLPNALEHDGACRDDRYDAAEGRPARPL